MSILKKNELKVIIGLGKTGLSCVEFYLKRGCNVAVMDSRESPPCLKELENLAPNIRVSLSGFDRELLNDATELVVSPGISLHEPLIASAVAKGVPVVGDIELFSRVAKAPICAITGTNAKTTVTSIVSDMARCAGLDARTGGNIGTPALNLLEENEPQFYILELSSFQLETTRSLEPHVATILNIGEDHMDRYSTLDDYIAAKQRIYNNCKIAVVNRNDENTRPQKAYVKKQITFGVDDPGPDEFGLIDNSSGLHIAFGSDCLVSVKDLNVKGYHNFANILAALSLGYAMNFPMSAMLKAACNFEGLPHRCQWIANSNGVDWYNDSKGTNVNATKSAIDGLGKSIDGKIVLIAGGLGKSSDFTELREVVGQYVHTMILIGKDAPDIERALLGVTCIIHANDIIEATSLANSKANLGDIVLLSPACASFDMFSNFEERGQIFMRAVKELLQ